MLPHLNVTAQDAFFNAIRRLYVYGLLPEVQAEGFTPAIFAQNGVTTPHIGDADENLFSEEAFKACLNLVCALPGFVESGTILEISPTAKFPFLLNYVVDGMHAATHADIDAVQARIIMPTLTYAHRNAIFSTLNGPNIKKTSEATDRLKRFLYTFVPQTTGRLSEYELTLLLSIVPNEKAQSLTIKYDNDIWPISIDTHSLERSIFLPQIPYNERVTICETVMAIKDYWCITRHTEDERTLVDQYVCQFPHDKENIIIANEISNHIIQNRRNSCWSTFKFLCCCVFCACYFEYLQSPLPFEIGSAYVASALGRSFKHDYIRFKQSSQVLAYWPIAAAFVLGVLGAIQTLISSFSKDKTPVAYVQGFGLAQTVLGLATTMVAGVAGVVKSTAEQKLRSFTHDLCTSTTNGFVNFFTEHDLNGNEAKILSRLGLVPRETPNPL